MPKKGSFGDLTPSWEKKQNRTEESLSALSKTSGEAPDVRASKRQHRKQQGITAPDKQSEKHCWQRAAEALLYIV